MPVIIDEPCESAPFAHLYLFYHMGSTRPHILVRRAYTVAEAMEELWTKLKKSRGPFGTWHLVALSEDGELKEEWVYKITDTYLSDPSSLTSYYMEDKCMMSRY